MSRVANYNINACDLNLGGIAIKELVSFEISPEGPAFADELGADGLVCRYATNEKRHNGNLVLKGSSEENAKLSALHNIDVESTNGAGIVPLLFRDGNGTTLIATDTAWITQLAPKTHASAPQDVTWTIRCVLNSRVSAIIGGN